MKDVWQVRISTYDGEPNVVMETFRNKKPFCHVLLSEDQARSLIEGLVNALETISTQRKIT